MRFHHLTTAVVALGFFAAAPVAASNGQGFGVCKSGFNDSTMVSTESRGEVTIAQVRINDRVWSFNEGIGKPGWSKVLRRVDAGPQYKILADFTEPESGAVTKACWVIKRAS